MSNLKKLVREQIELEHGMREGGIKRYEDNFRFHVRSNTTSDSLVGQHVLKELVHKVHTELDQRITKVLSGGAGRRSSAIKLLKDQDLKTISYLALRGILNFITKMNSATTVYMYVGGMVEDEILLADFREQDEKLFKRLYRLSKERFAVEYKRQLFLNVGMKENIKFRRWTKTERALVGAYLVEAVIESTGLIKEEVQPVHKGRGKMYREKFLMPTPECMTFIDQYHHSVNSLFLLYEPMIVEPRPWNGVFGGGYLSRHVKPLRLVKSYSEGYLEELKHWKMPMVYQAVNDLQSVPFVVDDWMLDIQFQLQESNATWAGIPATYNEDEPPRPEQLENESDADYEEKVRVWRREVTQVKKANRELYSKRAAFVQTLVTARKFSKYEKFFIPIQLDFRGRAYCVSNFNYQGSDHMKSLIRFERGKPLGEHGANWLAIHLANLASNVADVKLDKLSFEERVDWVYDNTDMIVSWADDPLTNRQWAEAGKKARFQLLQAAKEWAGYVREGDSFVSNVIVAMDASCSGLQHFACGLRCEETGGQVNLIPNDKPYDFYQTIADKVALSVKHDAEHGDEKDKTYAKAWLEYGCESRDLYKRNAMTYSYSSRIYGFKEQILEDHLGPRFKELCSWKRRLDNAKNKGVSSVQIVALEQQKPLWPFEGSGHKEAMYLAKHVWDALTKTVVKASEGMEWLRAVAMIASKSDLPLRWNTPVNFPILQAYWKEEGHRVDTYLHGSKRLRFTILEETDKINTLRQSNAVSPNFIHGNDSSHMMLTVIRSFQGGIKEVACVHDSFGCLAADMGGDEGFFLTIRDALVEMYSTIDVFDHFATEIKLQLPESRRKLIPPAPAQGSLDLSQITFSRYCFA